MPPRLEYQHEYQANNDEDKQEDALPPPRVLLIRRCDIELFRRFLHMHHRLLDVVLDTVHQCPLVYHHRLEVLEHFGERGY